MRAVAMGIVCASMAAACGGGGVDAVRPLQNGQLRYRATDTQGAALLTGGLRLVAHADSTVTGTWSIAWVAGADTATSVGPQVGSGTFSGRRLSDGQLEINLNPGYFDNNVFLTADRTVNGFSGSWSWSGLPGVLSRGGFSATYVAAP